MNSALAPLALNPQAASFFPPLTRAAPPLHRDVIGIIGAFADDAGKRILLLVWPHAAAPFRVRWMAQACTRVVQAHSSLWVTRDSGRRQYHLLAFRQLQQRYRTIPTIYILALKRLLVDCQNDRDDASPRLCYCCPY